MKLTRLLFWIYIILPIIALIVLTWIGLARR